MPALQKIYQAFTLLRFVGPALDSLHEDISRLQIVNDEKHEKIPLLLTNSIKLHQASYTYPDSLHPAIKDIDLNISARSKVGFIGITGSGKTTVVNLILGLLEPQEGNLKIDGQLITSANRKQWLRSIGYVPQNIYLADNSVTANIAFGINSKDIDQQAVEHASKIANLHEFVVKDLPQGYATIVGERGVRLSGGQRQRIGIARALYHKPQLLILDEGTSALDNLTQEIVMGSLNNLGYDITVIIVAHRLSTVRQCNQIFLLDKGKVKSKGTFEQLATTSDQFKEMLKIN
jgi:ABC-type multidrug transport system fused ATPase/permease subunit